MKALLVRAHLIESPGSEVFVWRFAATAFFFALLWLEVINHVKGEWSFNPQYAYGWSVPFLALYLFWKRWAARPAPRADRHPGLPARPALAAHRLRLPSALPEGLRPVRDRAAGARFVFYALQQLLLMLSTKPCKSPVRGEHACDRHGPNWEQRWAEWRNRINPYLNLYLCEEHARELHLI